MELKVGGVYRTRGGAKVRIVDNWNSEMYPYLGRFLAVSGDILDGNTYTETGHVYLTGKDDYDIVALWEDKEVAPPVPAKNNEVPTPTLVTSGEKCESPDAVFRPNHYTRLYPEPITVINAWGLNFNLGSAVKYIARNGHKGENTAEQDLSKAKRYIEIELERLRREKAIESGEATRSLLVETL